MFTLVLVVAQLILNNVNGPKLLYVVYRLFGWLLRIARLHDPGRREPGSRDATNLLAPVEPGSGCFKYRVSLALYLHVGNHTHTSLRRAR
jgi:hypothetical protein